MTIWVRSGEKIEEHVVASISETGWKVIYEDPEPDGYIGARVSVVYAEKENASGPD
jgi:hypothetical protein